MQISDERLRKVFAGENTASLRREAEDLDRLGKQRGEAFDRQFWIIVTHEQMAASDMLGGMAGDDPRIDPLVADMALLLDRATSNAVVAAKAVTTTKGRIVPASASPAVAPLAPAPPVDKVSPPPPAEEATETDEAAPAEGPPADRHAREAVVARAGPRLVARAPRRHQRRHERRRRRRRGRGGDHDSGGAGCVGCRRSDGGDLFARRARRRPSARRRRAATTGWRTWRRRRRAAEAGRFRGRSAKRRRRRLPARARSARRADARGRRPPAGNRMRVPGGSAASAATRPSWRWSSPSSRGTTVAVSPSSARARAVAGPTAAIDAADSVPRCPAARARAHASRTADGLVNTTHA